MLCQVVQFVLLLLPQLLLLFLLPHSCQMTVSDSFCALPLFRHLSLALPLSLSLVFGQRPFARRSSANNKHKQFIVGAANKSEKRLIKLRTQVQHIKYTSILSQSALPRPLPLSLSTFGRLPTTSAAALPCLDLPCPDPPWTVIVDRCLTLNC